MAHTPFQVARAEVADVAAIVALLTDARADQPVGQPLGTPEPDVLAQRLRAFLEATIGGIWIARSDQPTLGLVGLAVVQEQPAGLFSQSPWLQIEVLYVRPEYRRRSVGRLLIAEIAEYAEQCDLARIITQPVQGTRSEARFLSRLGFSAVGSRRSVEVATLRRRLEPEPARGGLETLIKRRRVMTGATPPRGIALGGQPAPGDHPEELSESSRQVRRAELIRRSLSSVTSTK